MTIDFPFGQSKIHADIPEDRIQDILVSPLHKYKAPASPQELINEALEHPIGSKKLCELSENRQHIVLLASDHTRPVPSKLIMPAMLREIRKGNPKAKITILIATGCHRGTTKQELIAKFGREIVDKEQIVIHDCDTSPVVDIGTLPSGGTCLINRLAVEADLLVSEGFIEPHFFAGYSGSRKSVLPGVASRTTVLANHCSEFIADSHSRTGILEGNLIHKDMVWAARKAKLAFIVNVVIDASKSPIYAVAGDTEAAHEVGCRFLSNMCKVETTPAPIVISTNGGYPLDQNIYQAVKGMTAAEAAVTKSGVIIMLARSNDGTGGDAFYHQMADEPDISKTLRLFMDRDRTATVPDQWQTQIFIRILQKATVIYISEAPDDMVRALHMIPAHSIEEALKLAENIVGNPQAKIIAIPDGVSVIVSGKNHT
ncbi:MAG: nickel-dependent lactate racemase [Spirochaetia bacterium]|jgi:nickel-dependent lactate racemase|nr:nickel-dependent lactate racemase [Spirochaetia bacterium]